MDFKGNLSQAVAKLSTAPKECHHTTLWNASVTSEHYWLFIFFRVLKVMVQNPQVMWAN